MASDRLNTNLDDIADPWHALDLDIGELRVLAAELARELLALRTTLAAIKAVDPDLFDPTGGTDRGAAYETYGSAGEELREKFLAAIGVNVNDYDEVSDGE